MTGKTLDELTPANVFHASAAANWRMQLWLIGETHRRLGEFGRTARQALLDAATREGKLDALGLHAARSALEREWGKTFEEWKTTFTNLRRQAATIPFGVMAVQHRAFVLANLRTQGERRLSESLPENTLDFVFNPQLQAIVDAAQRRVYSDRLQLSQRIWRLDQQSLQGIRAVLYNGIANGLSAWDIAKELEQYLGAGQDCPRWTRTRLNRLTKADIAAGDETGLIRGDECSGQGVAYNALRLARNEIQVAHAAATDAIVERLPWIEREKVNTSPAHAQRDGCDDVANGGPNGDGTYDKGTILLPIHVHCMCYKTAVLMKPEQFASKLRGWVRGTERWAAMDRYADSIGGNLNVDLTLTAAGQMLLTWLTGTYDDLTNAAQSEEMP